MDPSYNPNESVLSGGTESIMKVMGGGGVGEAPNGYNETKSMLTGGIEPILKVEGGGDSNTDESNVSIRYVSNYDLDNDAMAYYNNNIPNNISDIQAEIDKNKKDIKIKDSFFRKKHYHYNKNGKTVIPDTLADNLRGNITQLRFIPKNTKEIIVLPPVYNDPYIFFKQLAFLKDSKYILENNKLANNIFVISLEPFIKENNREIKPKIMDLNKEKGRLNSEKNRLNKTTESKISDVEKFYDYWADDKYDDTSLNIGFIFDRINDFNTAFENRIDEIKEKNDIDKLKFCINKMRYYTNKYIFENKNEKLDDNNKNLNKKLTTIFNNLNGNNQSGGEITYSQLLQHYYLKFKNINYDSYYVINQPYTLIYPKKVGVKEGIYFTIEDNNDFPKPIEGKNELLPTDNEEINEFNINSMAYKSNEDTNKKFTENEYYIISNGDNDVETHNTSLTFKLKKNIAILEVTDSDIPIIAVDIEGESYRIRVPKESTTKDSIYSAWIDKLFTKHEKKLLDDLNFIQMVNDKQKGNNYIANFLYYLVHYKCFNDTSLLTKNECNIVRDALKDLYMYKLYNKEGRVKLYANSNPSNYKNTRINCVSAGLGKEAMISCEIYTIQKGITKKGNVEINKPEGWDGTITDKMKQEAFNKWSKTK